MAGGGETVSGAFCLVAPNTFSCVTAAQCLARSQCVSQRNRHDLTVQQVAGGGGEAEGERRGI